jgi:hypothetical protein
MPGILRENAPTKRDQLFAKIKDKEITSIEQVNEEIEKIRNDLFLLIYNVDQDIPHIDDSDYIKSVIKELTFFYENDFLRFFAVNNKVEKLDTEAVLDVEPEIKKSKKK